MILRCVCAVGVLCTRQKKALRKYVPVPNAHGARAHARFLKV
jgi:hypothetical protein